MGVGIFDPLTVTTSVTLIGDWLSVNLPEEQCL